MERRIDEQLDDWAASKNRKPLLLFGARQVGKTFALRALGERRFDSVAYVDFSRDVSAAAIFDGSIEPHALVPQLEALLQMGIVPERTLIILDEVQLCERALTSLKYFCDDAPEYAVAAAGSLLGVKVNREGYSFPVGKVEQMTLCPMDFGEFLHARGEGRLADLIAERTTNSVEKYDEFALHDRATALLREYYLVGGMPEVVQSYVDKASTSQAAAFERARSLQRAIEEAYVADMTKYANAFEAPRVFEAWRSIPAQLAKENHKFQYSKVRTGGRANQYQTALSWLDSAGIVTRVTRVTDGEAPLRQFEDPESFKLYMGDTGLLSAAYDVLPADLLPGDSRSSRFRGGLAENYVLQQIVSRASVPYYWGTASKSEVEFVARSQEGDVLPIEVKSGVNVRANSLRAYREKYRPPYVVRVSSKNFGYANGIASLPLYAACFFAERLR